MEQNYLNTMRDVLDNGTWQKNERTGEMCCALDGAMTRFDISEAFTAAVTTKKLGWKSITGEFCAFLRGATSAADFRALGSKVWDQNANENKDWLANPFREGPDHLGDVYGAQWRRWPAYKMTNDHISLEGDEMIRQVRIDDKLSSDGWNVVAADLTDEHKVWHKEVDQLGECIRKLILNPSDRRILFHGWNPAKLDEIALPACHLLYQFLPNVVKRELNLAIYIRSWDTFLGGPFNIAEGGLLLELVSRLTGFKPKRLTIFSGDTHVYEKHLTQVTTQLGRESFPAPRLQISQRVPSYEENLRSYFTLAERHGWEVTDTSHNEKVAEWAIEWLDKVEPEDFQLIGYQNHPELKAEMAV